MLDACTIFGVASDTDDIAELLQEQTDAVVEVEYQDGRWSRITVRGEGSTLEFNCRRRKAPGDPFSNTILGTYNHARRINTDRTDMQKEICSHISDTQVIIGAVGSPAFDVEAGHVELIAEVTDEVEGIVFNGNDFLNSDWEILLGADGSSEVA